MAEYQIGDLVVFVDKNDRKDWPQWYPPVGTVGKVVELGQKNIGTYYVQWPSGTTSGDCKWWCRAACLKPAAEMVVEIDQNIAELVEQNDGYCPCAIEKTEDTKCPCKDFRTMESGVCECGRFEKAVHET